MWKRVHIAVHVLAEAHQSSAAEAGITLELKHSSKLQLDVSQHC